MSTREKSDNADTVIGVAEQVIEDIRRLLDGAEGFIITCAVRTPEHHRSVSGAYGTLTTGTISHLASTGEKIALKILDQALLGQDNHDECADRNAPAPGTIIH